MFSNSAAFPTVSDVQEIIASCRAREQLGCATAQLLKLQSFLTNSNVVDYSCGQEWHWYCNLTPHPENDVEILSGPSTFTQPQSSQSIVTQVATYLLTLHSYKDNSSTRKFKETLASLLRRCAGCVEGYLKAKRDMEEFYLHSFAPAHLDKFFGSIAKWEAALVVPLPIFSIDTSSPLRPSVPPRLSDLPPSLLHLVLSSADMFQEHSIRSLFEAEANLYASDDTTYELELEGFLDVRSFPAVGEGYLSLLFPWVPLEEAGGAELGARLKRLGMVLLPPKKSIPLDRLPYTLPTIERIISVLFSPAAHRDSLEASASTWNVFRLVLERLSDETIRDAIVLQLLRPEDPTGEFFNVPRGDRWSDEYCRGKQARCRTLVNSVCSRLGYNTPSFPHIFDCFLLLFRPALHSFWIDPKDVGQAMLPNVPSPPNPLAVFRTLKDNSAFLNHLATASPANLSGWISWLGLFIRSFLPTAQSEVRHHSLSPLKYTQNANGKGKEQVVRIEQDFFTEGLKEVIYFLVEGVQHSRFRLEMRALAMSQGFKILVDSHQTLEHYLIGSAQRLAVSSVYTIYASTIANVALSGKEYREDLWSEARSYAQTVCYHAMGEDGVSIRGGVVKLAEILQSVAPKKHTAPTPVLSKVPTATSPILAPSVAVRKELWERVYDTLGSKDISGLALLIRAVSKFSHIDVLPESERSAWSMSSLPTPEERLACRTAIHHLNQVIPITRQLFASSLERFANLNDPATLHHLWSTRHVTSSALSLLLSPHEAIHDSTQYLIQQSFNNISDRADCFRALIRRAPEEALRGIGHFLDNFVKCAALFPEACAMAKWMVRCLTDVIDVFCNHSADALLRDDSFVSTPGVRRLIPELWSKMCDSIAVVFERTDKWSQFYESGVMVDWMRDALIFARLMANETRTFEEAAVPSGQQYAQGDKHFSPVKMSTAGRTMISNLQKVLWNLLNWLRITDDETLHQSFELIKTLLDRFRRSQITPDSLALEKLNNFTQRAKGHRCKLSDGQLAEISEALSQWDIYDDDIMVVQSQPKSSSKYDEFDDEFPELSPADLLAFEKTTARLVQKTLPFGKAPVRPSSASLLSRASGGTGFGKIGSTVVKPKKTHSSTGAKSKAMKELRKDFKRQAPAIPQPGMKVGFQIKTSHAKSEIEPSKVNRRTDTADSSPSESSDSGDTDEEEENKGLAALSAAGEKRAPVVHKAVVPAPTRTIKMMNDIVVRTPGQIRAAQREAAQRTRLRLKPDMDELHRIILQWEPKDAGQYPPGMDPARLRKIPPTFQNANEYLEVLTPLLMLECWAQVQKAIEDSLNETRIVVAVTGKQHIDDWIDIDVVIPTTQIDQRYFLTDVDVVQVSSMDANQPASFFAKVGSFKKGFADVQITIRLHNTRHHHAFVTRSKWRLQRVLNLSTMHREFAGLRGLPYFDTLLSNNPNDTLLSAVLQGKSDPPLQFSEGQVKDTMRIYAVNEPQAKAVLAAMDPRASGFVLIQGPPGTGKTKTISGLVGKFLSDRPPPVTNIGAKQNAEPSPSLKILICAPSNAAIDEVAKRLKDGLRSSSGKIIVPKIVRLGNNDAVNIAVKDVHLDELVEQKLNGAASKNDKNDGAGEIARIRKELDELNALRNLKMDQRKQFEDDPTKYRALEEDVMKLSSRRAALTSQLNKVKDQDRDANRSLNAARRKARQDVINEADIICTTLSGAGHELLGSCKFETVIIDEAAQAVELSSLIPLKYDCRKCIMVGDPNQLPPTVLSKTADNYNYSESLFVRIQNRAPQNVHLLSIQYRMHPSISKLPSEVFYKGRLADGPDMAAKTQQSWHASPAFTPYKFYNVTSSREVNSSHGHSLNNPTEARVALNIYQNLKNQFPSVDFNYRVGIVTMYKDQKRELIKVFRSQYGQGITSTVDFNTVDGFQGQEKDIIILSCVRARTPGTTGGIGFLSDKRRMNVALTRAKSSLFIIGHAPTLEGAGAEWSGIVKDARNRGAMLEYGPTFSFSSVPMAAPISEPLTTLSSPPKPTLPHSPSLPIGPKHLSSKPQLDDLMTPKQMSQSKPHLKRSHPETTKDRAVLKQPRTEQRSSPSKAIAEERGNNSNSNCPSDHIPPSNGTNSSNSPPLKRAKPTTEDNRSKPLAPSLAPKKRSGPPKPKSAPNLFIPQKRKPAKPNPTSARPPASTSILPPFVSSDASTSDASAKARFDAFVKRPGGPSIKKR